MTALRPSRLRLLRLVLAGVAVAGTSVAVLDRPPGPAPLSAATTRPAAVLGAPSAPSTSAPASVAVPSVGIEAPLVPVALDGSGTLTPPADIATAGWLAQGPAPGTVGPAVLAGHVDSWQGPGAFFPLARVAVGAEVRVGRLDGSTLRFTVTRVARYAKDAFPAAEVYGPTTDAELRLITCGGSFDHARRSYPDDVVVYATAVT